MKFADVVEIRNGRNQRQVENANGKYPIYGSGGMMGYADDYICESETVVLGRKGSINNPIFVKEPFWNVDTAFGLVANRDFLLPRYLYYFCINYDFNKLNTTVTIPSLTKANLLQVEINVPDMNTQQRVVDILDKVSGLIELQQKQLHMLHELVSSRFIEMFGTIDLAIQKPSWSPLEDVTTIFTGTTPSTKEEDNWNGTIPWVTPAELKSDSFVIYDTERKITNKGMKSKSLCLMPVDTVLLSTRAPIGKVAITGVEMCCNQGFKNFFCNEELLNPIYLYTILQNNADYLNSLGTGTTFKEISKTNAGKIRVPIADINLQNKFADFVKQNVKSKFDKQIFCLLIMLKLLSEVLFNEQ